jgi:peptidoglycan/LPS O-acetylase OafA/YrhL
MLKPLTSLRFLAAAGVLFAHFGYSYNTGGIGVSFFFVLSGFILAHKYGPVITTWDKQTALKILVLRVARIYPVHLATLLITLPLVLLFGPRYSMFDTIANTLLLQSWYPNGENLFSFNGVSWTLSNELYFYLSLPIALLALNWLGLGRSYKKCLLTALVAIVLLLVFSVAFGSNLKLYSLSWWFLIASPFYRWLEFAIGLATGFLFNSIRTRPSELGGLTMTIVEIASIAVFACAYALHAQFFKHYRWNDGLYFDWAVASMILAFSFQRGFISRLLSNKVLMHLGEISFSLYMIHQPVIGYFEHFIHPLIYVSTSLKQTAWQVGASIAMVACADLLYRLVERPARDFAHRITMPRGGKHQVQIRATSSSDGA